MSLQSIKKSGSVKNSVSADEWQARMDLAACYRLMSHFGVNDLTYNHLSVRVPGEPGRLLLKPRTQMFDEVTASSLEKFEFDGTPCQDGPRNFGGGLVIHAGILEARADLNVVFHTHTAANMGVSSQKHGLLMINQHAVVFYKRMAYHDFGGFEFNLEQRAPLLSSLSTGTVMLLRNHGSLVCAATLQAAFIDHHYLETACRGQVAALAGGVEVTLITEEVCEIAVKQYNPAKSGDKDWPACIRLANRLDPSYTE